MKNKFWKSVAGVAVVAGAIVWYAPDKSDTALPQADPDAPANRLVPEREPVESFTSWLN